MNRNRILVTAIFLAACGGKDGDTGDTDAAVGSCASNNILDSHPVAGETSAYWRTVVDYHFAVADAGATLSVTDAAGAEVAGTVENLGTYIVWTPSDALTPGISYTSTLEWTCGTEEATFTIGTDLGGPSAAADLVGRAWTVDLRSARGGHPLDIAGVLGTLIQFNLLIGVTAEADGSLDLLGAVATPTDSQDACIPSIPFENPADYSADPYMTVSSSVLPIEVGGSVLEIEDMTLTATFSTDGTTMDGVTLSGIVDTRPLAGVIDESGGADAGSVCELFSDTFKIECQACPSGDGDFCIDLRLDSMTAPESGFPLGVITPDDIAGNPDCVPE